MLPYPAEKLTEFFSALKPLIRGDLRTDAMTRALYATDASMYQIEPVGVLLPRHVDDVQAALETASRFAIPVLPRGGGSSLAGQTVGASLVIDFSRHINALLELNAEEQWARVQPGLVLDHLNAALKPHHLMVGPDPASSNRATLGGMLANNATGTHSILYGNVINHVRSARTLLADGSSMDVHAVSKEEWEQRGRRKGLEGQIFRKLGRLLEVNAEIIKRDTPRHWRRNSGYRLEHLLEGEDRNVAKLLCGSEGTLAVVTELTISLVSRPKQTALGVVHFQTRTDALRAVTTILQTRPSAVELFDGVAIEQTRKAPGFAHLLTFIRGNPGAVLITEYYGETVAELTARLDDLEQTLVRTKQGYAIVRAMDAHQIANVWNVRNEGLGLIMSVRGDRKPVAFIEDASVPVEHLADYIEDLDRLLEETDTPVAMYAHASAGTLHVRPFINTKDAREVEKMREIATGSMELVRKYGGAVSSEHGDGIARSWLNEYLVGAELYRVYREVKTSFDPGEILNPGKVVNAPAMTENLRMGPDYGTLPLAEKMDFSESGGFAGMVELCNGNGACRKLQSGTMCPSYMATLEEEHSTRGRANALRAAMSGTLPPDAFTSRRLYEVLDLCVACKGCKTECPSNVDMAKLKTEWLSRYWEANGMPLRAKLFAHMPQIARMASGKLAAPVNRVNSNRLVRALLTRAGIAPERKLPEFAAMPFSTWFHRQNWRTSGPEVVLFADTFYNYNHPETSRAAAQFLYRTGHQVHVPDSRACCGRPLLSKGLVDEAQRYAQRAVEILYPYVERGLPVIGLEPSCILTFRDEFLALLPGDYRAGKLAEVTFTFEEFVAQQSASGGSLEEVHWKHDERQILMHGHCHQKAIVGTGPAERALSLPPGYSVKTIDSSCCGMAGAFGYEREHYDVSIRMAERRLAPAVRAAAEDAIIVAAGTSCRTQIEDTAGRRALHPAEVLLGALA